MKVLSIREQHRQKDDKLYWKVTLENSPHPLILWDTPPFSEGQDVSRDSLALSGDVWVLKAEQSDKDASIREQTAIKIVADLLIADKLKELVLAENPTDRPPHQGEYLIKALRDWIDRALIQGPLMQKILEAQHGSSE